MSIFKDSWIILKIQKQANKDFLYTIFSYKFWKIFAIKKLSNKEKQLDLWYHINYEIRTNTNINKISNIKIINEFNNQNKTFNELNSYLQLLSIILHKTAFWVENIEIFEIVSKINKYKKQDLEIKIILASLKVIHILWELNIENKNSQTAKILKFISINNFSKIIKLSWINEDIKKELQNIL